MAGVLHILGEGINIKIENVKDPRALLSAVCEVAASGAGANTNPLLKSENVIPPEKIRLAGQFMINIAQALGE